MLLSRVGGIVPLVLLSRVGGIDVGAASRGLVGSMSMLVLVLESCCIALLMMLDCFCVVAVGLSSLSSFVVAASVVLVLIRGRREVDTRYRRCSYDLIEKMVDIDTLY